jgi:3-deoxy-7-phosphoheptulonate synthase
MATLLTKGLLILQDSSGNAPSPLCPSRLWLTARSAYFHSAATLNFIRGSLSSGIADLHRPLDWGLGHVHDPELQVKYSNIVSSITESLRFMRTVGADTAGQLQSVDLYTSHEGLLLDYEQSLTRRLKDPSRSTSRAKPSTADIPDDGKSWYNTGAHFLWIGDRTRQIDGAHIEYFRGIENPIGIKIGPTTSSSDLLALLRILNPSVEVGKIVLITRYGASKVRALLPTHIRIVEGSEYARSVVWQCDPMHGNTRSTATGIKTRQFSDIFSELQQTLAIHKQEGSYLGGVHLELTGDAVTECTGGSVGLADEDLSLNYTSFCDPRLNEKQALEMAFLIAGHYRSEVRQKAIPLRLPHFALRISELNREQTSLLSLTDLSFSERLVPNELANSTFASNVAKSVFPLVGTSSFLGRQVANCATRNRAAAGA